jgi:hypothetical protein
VSLRLRRVALLAFTALLVVSLYYLLHEAGHALAGLLFGGRLLEFNANPFSPDAHALIDGRFSHVQRAAVFLAGLALPLLAWAGFLLAAPRRANPLLETVKVVSTMGVLNTLLPWIITPLSYRPGTAQAGHDVAQFLAWSGIPPLWAAVIFLAAYVAGWALFLARIEGVAEEAALLAAARSEGLTSGPRRTLWTMAGLAAGAALVAVSIRAYLSLVGG